MFHSGAIKNKIIWFYESFIKIAYSDFAPTYEELLAKDKPFMIQ